MSFYVYKLGTTKSVAKAEVIAIFYGKLSSDDKLLDCGQNTYIRPCGNCLDRPIVLFTKECLASPSTH